MIKILFLRDLRFRADYLRNILKETFSYIPSQWIKKLCSWLAFLQLTITFFGIFFLAIFSIYSKKVYIEMIMFINCYMDLLLINNRSLVYREDNRKTFIFKLSLNKIIFHIMKKTDLLLWFSIFSFLISTSYLFFTDISPIHILSATVIIISSLNLLKNNNSKLYFTLANILAVITTIISLKDYLIEIIHYILESKTSVISSILSNAPLYDSYKIVITVLFIYSILFESIYTLFFNKCLTPIKIKERYSFILFPHFFNLNMRGIKNYIFDNLYSFLITQIVSFLVYMSIVYVANIFLLPELLFILIQIIFFMHTSELENTYKRFLMLAANKNERNIILSSFSTFILSFSIRFYFLLFLNIPYIFINYLYIDNKVYLILSLLPSIIIQLTQENTLLDDYKSIAIDKNINLKIPYNKFLYLSTLVFLGMIQFYIINEQANFSRTAFMIVYLLTVYSIIIFMMIKLLLKNKKIHFNEIKVK